MPCFSNNSTLLCFSICVCVRVYLFEFIIKHTIRFCGSLCIYLSMAYIFPTSLHVYPKKKQKKNFCQLYKTSTHTHTSIHLCPCQVSWNCLSTLFLCLIIFEALANITLCMPLGQVSQSLCSSSFLLFSTKIRKL